MNTKILLLTIALVLIFPSTFSAGASSQKQIINLENSIPAKAGTDNKQPDRPTDWSLAWAFDDSIHHSRSEEDGKIHHFHYERMYRNRRRSIWVIFFKLVLFLVHASSFVFSNMYVWH